MLLLFDFFAEILGAVFHRIFSWGEDNARDLKTPATWIVYFYRVTGLIALALILLVVVGWVRAQGWWPFT